MLALDFLAHLCRKHGDAIALSDSEQQASYQDLLTSVQALASALQVRDPSPGSRVGICALHSPEYTVCLLAVLAAGKVPVPLDPQGDTETLHRILYETQPTAVFVDEAGAAAAQCDDQLCIPISNLPGLVLTYRDHAPERHAAPGLDAVLASCLDADAPAG